MHRIKFVFEDDSHQIMYLDQKQFSYIDSLRHDIGAIRVER